MTAYILNNGGVVALDKLVVPATENWEYIYTVASKFRTHYQKHPNRTPCCHQY